MVSIAHYCWGTPIAPHGTRPDAAFGIDMIDAKIARCVCHFGYLLNRNTPSLQSYEYKASLARIGHAEWIQTAHIDSGFVLMAAAAGIVLFFIPG